MAAVLVTAVLAVLVEQDLAASLVEQDLKLSTSLNGMRRGSIAILVEHDQRWRSWSFSLDRAQVGRVARSKLALVVRMYVCIYISEHDDDRVTV